MEPATNGRRPVEALAGSGHQRRTGAQAEASLRGDEVVVGEAVELELLPASFATRLLAFVVDLCVVGVAALLTFWALALLGLDAWSPAAQAAAISVALAVILLVIPTTVETLSRGRSLGKLAAGIRVVCDDGTPVRLRQSAIRALVGVFEIWFTLGFLAFATMFFNNRGKRIGDFLAGTYAMRSRGPRLQVFSLPMPPELVAWAKVADIGALSDGLALRVRQFLLRAGSLSAQARHQLGLSLAAEVGRQTAPPPPAGTHPERYLAAVICERRDRQLASAPVRATRAQALAGAVRRLPYQIPDPSN
ncbi:MAG: RDD family protein [Bifidobacteriaceae bacterium]|jgi:uncharacterized RDD family membrane protein YckC|nr:RDD family protein [Bifidobacteriaceae bacterium]